MPRLVSRADLARRKGVSRAAVTQACEHGLAPACVGDRIDLDHEAAVEYLAETDGAPTKAPKPASNSPADPTAPTLDKDGFSDELADYTLHEIVTRYGTIRSYKDLLEANEKRERALKNHLDNELRRGTLVSRELVEKHVIGLIDATNKQLLSDAAKTVSGRVMAMAKGGSTIEECERVVREIISSHIKPTKRRSVQVLRDAAIQTAG